MKDFEAYKVAGLFSFLYPKILMARSSTELKCSCEQLTEQYPEDLEQDVFSELVLLRRTLSKQNLPTTTKPVQVVKFIVSSNLQEAFPNVLTAYLLLLTIPVSIASCERSFSKLKIIKNYLRSTMAQERLTGLSLLSIEHEIATQLSLDRITKTFACAKARRKH